MPGVMLKFLFFGGGMKCAIVRGKISLEKSRAVAPARV